MNLELGHVINGKLVVKQVMWENARMGAYLCQTVSEGTAALVHVVNLTGVSPEIKTALAADIQTASRLRHKNIVPCVGFGEFEDHLYLAEKAGQGRPLVEHLERRAGIDKPFKPGEAFSLLSHVCNAIQFAADKGGHGALLTSHVLINSNGRVQVGGFGFGRMRSSFETNSEWDAGCLAAQVDSQASADLSSLGVVAAQLLTGRPWPDGLEKPPAKTSGRVLDALVKSQRQDVDVGLPSPIEFRRAVKRLFVVTVPPPPVREETPSNLNSADPLDQPMDKGDTLRWLVERDGIDYGPFTRSQILEQLYDGTLTPRSILVDIETEKRTNLFEFEQFEAEMLKALHHKDDEESKAEAALAVKQDRLVRRVKVWGGLSAFLVIAAVAGAWQYTVSTRPEPSRPHLASAVQALEWTLPIISAPEKNIKDRVSKRRTSKTRKGRLARSGNSKSWSRAERARMLEEEQMAANSDLDAEGGAKQPFSRRAFDRVLATRTARIYRCLLGELKARPGTQDMVVTLTAMASGQILNVRMAGGTVKGVRCVRRAFKGAKIPAFAGTNKTISLPYRLN
ncbi:MAG: protein kinase [Myxococcota bacterium]|nr:protein kinase [Myxococcota bacterium]